MKIVIVIKLLMFALASNEVYYDFKKDEQEVLKSSPNLNNENLTSAIKDIIQGLPAPHVNLLFDNFSDTEFPELMSKKLHEAAITTSVYLIKNEQHQEQFCQYVRESLSKYQDVTSIIFSNRNTAIDLFWMLQQQDLMHRKVLYMFYWDHQLIESEFSTDHFEAMRIAVISSPRSGIYRVYYSQADPLGISSLSLVNWWSSSEGLFRHPLLPSADKVYKNFKGRIFEIPVLHKPPWNFVEYTNDSFRADGGRDDKLLTVIAEKLNFQYKYVDPPERVQGSGLTENGTFPGVLGLVWQREVDFFMGDVTITYDRAKAVEFSFFTLVDSEAFVTHRPSKLNEAFALVRPFQWQVWVPIVSTFAVYGPILYGIIELPYTWMKIKRSSKKREKLFWNCIWFSISTFLRQGGIYPAKSHKVRLVLIIVTLGATYVIGDMYSANLTSLLARPGREKPITTLEQLEVAMNTREYNLLVEKHSSSYSTLQNGTGIYERLWKKMQTQQQFMIESVESGMKLVRKKKNIAIFGGRETLFFDSKRFGSYNFQLSEKLNTRYAAIAMQMGCPYIENFNRILMQLFEGGILSKMTEEEYAALAEKQRAAAGKGNVEEKPEETKAEDLENPDDSIAPRSKLEEQEEEEQKLENQILGFDTRHQLQPLSIRMLQGAFYILFIGYFLSGITLLLEMKAKNCQKLFGCHRRRYCFCWHFFEKCNFQKMRYQLRLFYSKFVRNSLNEFLQVKEETENNQMATTNSMNNNQLEFNL